MSSDPIHTLIDQEQFHQNIQPIFDLSNQSEVGYEVLLRSSLYSNPETIFEKAKKINRLYELEIKLIEKAIASCSESKWFANVKLFINVFPSTITHPDFFAFINHLTAYSSIQRQQLVFEINEAEMISDILTLKKRLSDLKKSGFLFAIDDVGKGAASLRTMVELEPDFVKMDQFFTIDLSISEHKQEMLKSILSYCENINSQLIIEGIEKANDLKAAKSLGAIYGQGFYLGMPVPIKD